MTFEDLGLMPRLVKKLTEQGIKDPTPIQIQAIPHALKGEDVMGLAQTGTGKTAAFGLPIMHHLLKEGSKPEKKSVRGLILAPTRELAGQIKDNLLSYSQGTHIKVNLVVGGLGIKAQINRLARGTDLLIATPGRLIDLLDREAVDLSKTHFLVLDEADQMLDLGFIHALRRIAPLLASNRQTMLFSATMPKHMTELANTYLKNPKRVAVSRPGEVADKIIQEVHFLAGTAKTDFLIEKLSGHIKEAAIVFARTKHGSERLMKALSRSGLETDSVHGNKSQSQRQKAIDALRNGKIKVLVATDVAARGLDIPDVRFVYNYDLPNVSENYIHRIGRTARAGRDGRAISFVAPDEMDELKNIEKVLTAEIPIASGRRWDLVPGVETHKTKRKRATNRDSSRNKSSSWTKGEQRRDRTEENSKIQDRKPSSNKNLKLKGRWDPTNDSPEMQTPTPKSKKRKIHNVTADTPQGADKNRIPEAARHSKRAKKKRGKTDWRKGQPKERPNVGGNSKLRRPRS